MINYFDTINIRRLEEFRFQGVKDYSVTEKSAVDRILSLNKRNKKMQKYDDNDESNYKFRYETVDKLKNIYMINEDKFKTNRLLLKLNLKNCSIGQGQINMIKW